MIKILYIYNLKNWAIHNVGRLWLKGLPNVKVTFKSSSEIKNNFKNYDFVWFGYLDLYLQFMHDINKSIISIHDPCELFPQVKNWKNLDSKMSIFTIGLKKWIITKNRLKIIKKLKNIVVASKEMKNLLEKCGVKTNLIPTMSLLQPIKKHNIVTKKASIISVLQMYPRKNFQLLKFLQEYCNNKKIKFDIKLGTKILSKKDYIKLLDSYEIYICTSFQEGGPIPAMDAMNRGLTVLTTSVGQIQEVINSKNEKNGFICKTKDDFISKINLLSNNIKLLHKMRIKSRESIIKERNEKIIKDKVKKFVDVINNIKKQVQPTLKSMSL